MPEYSISQLGKFEECALQYKLIYVDGIKRELKAFFSTEKLYTVTPKEESGWKKLDFLIRLSNYTQYLE